MKKRDEIKVIVFDSNGVLFLARGGTYSKAVRGHHSIGIHEYMANKLKVDLDQWFDAIDTAYVKSIEGKIKRDKVVEIISKNLKVSQRKFVSIMKKAYNIHFKKNKELYKIIKKLKKQNYMIGILSDQWHLSKEAILSKRNMKPFEIQVVSCDVGLRKPDIEIYKLLMKRIKKKDKDMKNKEVLFIDNQEWNLKPARKSRMKTILFKDNKQFVKDLKKLGVSV